jgi:hypothetical protein
MTVFQCPDQVFISLFKAGDILPDKVRDTAMGILIRIASHHTRNIYNSLSSSVA